MDERLLLKVEEHAAHNFSQRKMIIYECPEGHLKQTLEGIKVECSRCGQIMGPRK